MVAIGHPTTLAASPSPPRRERADTTRPGLPATTKLSTSRAAWEGRATSPLPARRVPASRGRERVPGAGLEHRAGAVELQGDGDVVQRGGKLGAGHVLHRQHARGPRALHRQPQPQRRLARLRAALAHDGVLERAEAGARAVLRLRLLRAPFHRALEAAPAHLRHLRSTRPRHLELRAAPRATSASKQASKRARRSGAPLTLGLFMSFTAGAPLPCGTCKLKLATVWGAPLDSVTSPLRRRQRARPIVTPSTHASHALTHAYLVVDFTSRDAAKRAETYCVCVTCRGS
eukprot:scaffold2286_cov283-Prasinococcus_capsulatus_cf.AAC.1